MDIRHHFDFDDLDLRIETGYSGEPPLECTGHETCNGTDSLRTGTLGCSPGCRN